MFSEIKLTKSQNGIERAKVKNNEREVIIKIGNEMIVKPLNKQKLKHRDRRVIINKIIDEGFKGVNAFVEFLDTKRTGKVDITDLDYLILRDD